MKKLFTLITLTIITLSMTGCAAGKAQPSIAEAPNVKVFLTNDGYYWNTHKISAYGKSNEEKKQMWEDMWISTLKIADDNGYKYFGFINEDSIDFRKGFPINTYSNFAHYLYSKKDGKKDPIFDDTHHCFKLIYFKEKPSGVFVFDVEQVKKERELIKNKTPKFVFFVAN